MAEKITMTPNFIQNMIEEDLKNGLKHRIDSKITVLKATESHGSSVQISC